MMMTRDEILSLLDMSEDDQYDWLIFGKILKSRGEIGLNSGIYYEDTIETLADCAFRLRDECIKCGFDWYSALKCVVNDLIPNASKHKTQLTIDHTRPIIWIVAALLAKAGE